METDEDEVLVLPQYNRMPITDTTIFSERTTLLSYVLYMYVQSCL